MIEYLIHWGAHSFILLTSTNNLVLALIWIQKQVEKKAESFNNWVQPGSWTHHSHNTEQTLATPHMSATQDLKQQDGAPSC